MSLSLTQTYENFDITASEDREAAFGQSDHVRIYARDYKARLEEAGFKVNEFDWTGEAMNFGGESNKFCLIKEEKIYFACKQ